VLPLGSTIRNHTYAQTLTEIARLGPREFLTRGGGARLINSVQRGTYSSWLSEADLQNYRAESREPLCALFLTYKVCAMGPSSFGGLMVLQILQLVQMNAVSLPPEARFNFDHPEFVHVYAEAGRLAQADRLRYVGDPAFVQVPTQALLADAYLRDRARLISAHQRMPDSRPGTVAQLAEHADATSQLAVVDEAGNALSLTTTNNLNFGSRLMVDGYVLNNAMTNFSAQPRAGQVAPNRMEAGKRPVTSMAPIIVFDPAGKPLIVGGSAGGGQIVDYIARSLIEMLANRRTPAQALTRGNVSTAIAGKIQLEKGTDAANLAKALVAKGHSVEVVPMVSGQGFLLRQDSGWIGAADPRRDGVALGY
jgi:gamma-glutamyltranspeptidase / glutathione hydrolase